MPLKEKRNTMMSTPSKANETNKGANLATTTRAKKESPRERAERVLEEELRERRKGIPAGTSNKSIS